MADAASEQEKQSRPERERISRRTLLMKIGILLNGMIAAAVAIPVVGFLLAPIRRKDGYNSWIELGALDTYPAGETRLATYRNPFTRAWDGETAKVACWVRHIEGNEFQVFAINCAHLGCPVRWFPQSQLFMCPCHGGVYYADGSRASGPPERGLFEYRYRVENGKLLINAGQTPTLSNEARLQRGNAPCPGTSGSTIG